MFWEEEPKRRAFTITTKKTQWMIAAGEKVFDSSGKRRFVKKSKCRKCKTILTWGNGRYDFDHKDNNPANNSLANCYLVCKSCHGEATVIKKRKVKGFLGETVGYKTIKKKVGYKKPKKKPKTTRRVAVRDLFGNVTGYRTVKVRQTKTAKKKTTRKKPKRKTASKAKKTTRKKKAKKSTKKRR